MRLVVLVDGEHYPPVVRAAVEDIRAAGDDVVAAIFCGGTEKVGSEDLSEAYGGMPVHRDGEVTAILADALDRHRPDAVLDLSGEPVLSAADRFRLASIVLSRGAAYRGADFELRPPPVHEVLTKSSVRVIATGKRVGKTAVAGALARHAVDRGHSPVIVAMGRGGPGEPDVLDARNDVSPKALLELADAGKHAASDYVEDAVTSRVTTIGCRRVGDGLAGAPYASNVVKGARLAEDRPEDLVILEGSGSAIPPVAANATLLCVPALRPGDIAGFLGPYRLLLADVAIVTMAEEGSDAPAVEAAARETTPDLELVRTVFRPRPLAPIEGRRVFVCSTAPSAVTPVLRDHLESEHGCRVVGWSSELARRADLEAALENAPEHDVLLTEVKAAAIDVAVRAGLARGTDVVFADNVLIPVGADEGAVERAFDVVLQRAQQARDRHGGR